MTTEETEELIDELNLVEHKRLNFILYRGCEIPIGEQICFDVTIDNQN
jgi:hypothetical protein